MWAWAKKIASSSRARGRVPGSSRPRSAWWMRNPEAVSAASPHRNRTPFPPPRKKSVSSSYPMLATLPLTGSTQKAHVCPGQSPDALGVPQGHPLPSCWPAPPGARNLRASWLIRVETAAVIPDLQEISCLVHLSRTSVAFRTASQKECGQGPDLCSGPRSNRRRSPS